ncbi:hypothetical protein BDV93DRAFT_522526 [Ceratobasidium sp. AG-I]|nr:hypothetical protein BDV93DRAFT_522526 [Ceratobasidium sp. AG-I]
MPYEYFGRAHHISTLTVGRDIFRPAFLQAVGSLPCLTNLRIHNFDFRTESLPDVTLSSESFPVLRKMTIEDFCPASLIGVFNYLPLVRNVTTLFMQISDPLSLTVVEITTLFSAIARASPSIDDLCINFDYDADLKAPDLAALSPLPLRTLSLSTCDITIGSPHDFCPILANSFPQLQRLIMPTQDAYFWDLCWFTELKQLEYLSVMVYWWPSEKRSHSKDSPSQSSSKLHTLECDISRPRTFDI